MRLFARRVAFAIWRTISLLLSPLFAPVAKRGVGTEACLRNGFLPVPVHFYQPVFDADSLNPEVWERRHAMPGVTFNVDGQLDQLRRLARFAPECDWPERPSGPGYYSQNGSFGYSSACLLHAVLRDLRPARVVEVGAGMSTLLIAAALRANGQPSELVSIDPYPAATLDQLPADSARMIRQPVECVGLDQFRALADGDLLFIDSSHVVRTGGDVNFLYLDVLPRLASGVVVHIHDIQLPYEYPKVYAAQRDAPRYFWTEQYLLQAFLSLNPCYEVTLAGHYLQREHQEEFMRCFPGLRPSEHRLTSSFYMRRTAR